MIGYLRGTVLLAPHVSGGEPLLLDVNGVGYNVFVAGTYFAPGDECALYVHTIVRADALLLFGFTSLDERRIFETLLATPGVGPSTALAALRTLGLDELTLAIESGDVKKVGTVPGVGPKTASRIVLELKGKLVLPDAKMPPTTSATTVSADIEDALRGWGYSSAEIREALRDVELPADDSAALKMALGLLRRS